MWSNALYSEAKLDEIIIQNQLYAFLTLFIESDV